MSKRKRPRYNRRKRYTKINSPCKINMLRRQVVEADLNKPLAETVKELNALLTERKV